MIINQVVSGGAPEFYIEKAKDANGKAINSSYLMDFSQFTDVGDFVFSNAYRNNTNISGIANMSSLTTISGNNACSLMFNACNRITSADLSSLTTVSGPSACQGMFGASGITSADLSSLTTISGNSACQAMFSGCTSLTSIDISSLETISGISGCDQMFAGCLNLPSITFSSLKIISGSGACGQMMFNCKNKVLNFPALTSTSFPNNNNQFNNMLFAAQNTTVHFPSNLDPNNGSTVISSLQGYPNFGGTNTTLVFDLPATE